MFNIQPKLEKLKEKNTGGTGVGDREKQNALQSRIRKQAFGLSRYFCIVIKIFTWNVFI